MAVIENYKELGIETYSCGSQRLSHAIRTKLDMQPIKTYTTERGKIINVFILTPMLSVFLREWTANRPTKEGRANGHK